MRSAWKFMATGFAALAIPTAAGCDQDAWDDNSDLNDSPNGAAVEPRGGEMYGTEPEGPIDPQGQTDPLEQQTDPLEQSEPFNDTDSSIQSESADANTTGAEDAVDFDEVKKEMNEAAEAVADYSSEKRDEFTAEMREELKEMDAKIDEWKSKSEGLSAEAKATWEERRESLEAQRYEIEKKLNELAYASGESWEETKDGVSKAWDELEKTADRASEPFDD